MSKANGQLPVMLDLGSEIDRQSAKVIKLETATTPWPEPIDILARPNMTGVSSVDETCVPRTIANLALSEGLSLIHICADGDRSHAITTHIPTAIAMAPSNIPRPVAASGTLRCIASSLRTTIRR